MAALGMDSVFKAARSGALSRRRRSAAGFTLVELLMVILIISMLMGMLSVAIWKAFEYVQTSAMVMEIDQLHNAMSAYKEKTGQYPPCLGELTVTDRKVRFMRHLQVAYSNSNYGVTAAHFDNLRNNLMAAGRFGTASQAYTYRDASGSPALLDLYKLDQAEALVFWLGGFPTPCNSAGTPVAPSRLYGFNLDKDNPMRRDSTAAESTDPMRFRDIGKMEFKQDRFADIDGDGWLEYMPQAYQEGTQPAPFVYFDAPTYVASTTPPGAAFNITNLLGYPRATDTNGTASPTASGLAAIWGLAVPMAMQYDVGGAVPMQWRNDKNFQIICPGRDQAYSAGETGDLTAAMRFSVYPGGDTYTKAGGYKTRTSYSIQELDNLNNLGTVTLDAARSQNR